MHDPAPVSSPTTLSKNQRDRLERRIIEIESRIETLEDTVAKLSAEISSPEIAGDFARLQEATKRLEETENEIRRLYEEWERSQESLASAAAKS